MFAASAVCLVFSDAALAGSEVRVSCYRGPWDVVIWDRANPEFVDSLEANGVDPTEAQLLADSICRDQRLVDNPEAMAEAVRRLLSQARRG